MKVPEGWKLVPIESTREMLEARWARLGDDWSPQERWEAMLAAAPTPPAQTIPLKAFIAEIEAYPEMKVALDEARANLAKQEPLGKEFEDALYQNLNQLYESTPPAQEDDVNTFTPNPVVAHETGNVNDKQEDEPVYTGDYEWIDDLVKRLPHVRPGFVEEVKEMSPDELKRRLLIGSDWIGSFSCSLDGIPGLVAIPGGGIDGCRLPRNIRDIVTHLVKQERVSNDKLRKAAEEALEILEEINSVSSCTLTTEVIADLRAALEGK